MAQEFVLGTLASETEVWGRVELRDLLLRNRRILKLKPNVTNAIAADVNDLWLTELAYQGWPATKLA